MYSLQCPQQCTRPVYLAQSVSGSCTKTKRQVASAMRTVPRVKSDQHERNTTVTYNNWNELPCSIRVMKLEENMHVNISLIYSLCLSLDEWVSQATGSCCLCLSSQKKNTHKVKENYRFHCRISVTDKEKCGCLVVVCKGQEYRLPPIPEKGISKEYGQVRTLLYFSNSLLFCLPSKKRLSCQMWVLVQTGLLSGYSLVWSLPLLIDRAQRGAGRTEEGEG